MTTREKKEYVCYQTTMSVLRKMLNDGMITEEEFRKMEQYFAQKYGLEFSIIYR